MARFLEAGSSSHCRKYNSFHRFQLHMDRRLFEILSFGAPYAGLATLAYYLGAQVVTLSPK